MAIDKTSAAAQLLRDTHDRQALHAYIDATFEPYDEVPPSKVIKPDTYVQDFPSDLDERIKAMEERLRHEEPEAIRIRLRYEEIRTGDFRLSTAARSCTTAAVIRNWPSTGR